MEGHAEMEMLRTLKGPSTGEVSVHLVARGSPGSGPHLPTTAFIIPASSATLGLPSSSLDVPCFPREPIHVGAPQRVPGSVPVMATVLPQLSAGPAPGPASWGRPTVPATGVRATEHGGSRAAPEPRAAPGTDLPHDPPGDPPQDPPENGATCQCQACEPQPGSRPDPGSSRDGCPPLFQER
ncbi:PREDICTED: lethal(3)malignant brain tumor-like protein 1 [Myotis brandtii]|uniref:lethal(3)malignant brain tumor-like protein 1 n=1 Tax=Myotis brandtii TaxID=109478 RepID=UPI000703F22D|nr:PREDICTED: lethal(3)malignant brain tumor-like protein 1 [Myotis brandtii]